MRWRIQTLYGIKDVYAYAYACSVHSTRNAFICLFGRFLLFLHISYTTLWCVWARIACDCSNFCYIFSVSLSLSVFLSFPLCAFGFINIIFMNDICGCNSTNYYHHYLSVKSTKERHFIFCIYRHIASLHYKTICVAATLFPFKNLPFGIEEKKNPKISFALVQNETVEQSGRLLSFLCCIF